MTRIVRCLGVLLAAALAFAGPACAQADTARITTALWAACPGAEVRVAAAADSVRGYCGPIEDGRLVVRHRTDEWRIPLTQIDSVWVRQRTTGTGVRRGALWGAVALGGFGLWVGHGLCESPSGCGSDAMQVAGVGALLGALGGLLIGGFIGHTVSVWDRRYP